METTGETAIDIGGPGSKPLRFEKTPLGCDVIVSHRLNKDGYFRKRWGSNRKGDSEIEMFHRFIFRAHYGEIPKGYSVHHICGNRACSNPKHLELVKTSEHASQHNRVRNEFKKTK